MIGADVVHAFLERAEAHAVREAHAALVEQDAAGRRRRAASQRRRYSGMLPEDLEVRERPHRHHEVERPLADDLVSDVDVAAARVPDRRAHGTGTRTDSQLVARPSLPHSISTPSMRTSPEAVSKRTGMPVRI